MLEKQRQTLHDLEEEDDCQSTEAIAELHQVICATGCEKSENLQSSYKIELDLRHRNFRDLSFI